jgi:glucose-1-phosphatase
MAIKNLIFDLGNVIIDIDPALTYQAFAKLSKKLSATEVEQRIKAKNFWLRYETGEFDNAQFRDLLRDELFISASDQALDHAFNALLLDIDPHRIELIEQLGQKYRLFMLSNTSSIHFEEVENILYRCSGRRHFAPMFEHLFLSWEMKKIKPNADIYEQVLSDAKLVAQETLFTDDLKANVEAAAQLGIQIVHLQAPTTILDIEY